MTSGLIALLAVCSMVLVAVGALSARRYLRNRREEAYLRRLGLLERDPDVLGPVRTEDGKRALGEHERRDGA